MDKPYLFMVVGALFILGGGLVLGIEPRASYMHMFTSALL
jgi:hypothetical protein